MKPLTCQLTTPYHGLDLSNVVLDFLARELPEVRFGRVFEGRPNAVWLYGYQPGDAAPIERVRAEHPGALLLVTGRGPVERWRDEVLAAGASVACSWPLPFAELRSVFLEARDLASTP